MTSLMTLGALVFVALFLGVMLLKRGQPTGTDQPSSFVPSFNQPAPKDEHGEAIAVMSQWYREEKRKEFEAAVLKDVVEKFSAKKLV